MDVIGPCGVNKLQEVQETSHELEWVQAGQADMECSRIIDCKFIDVKLPTTFLLMIGFNNNITCHVDRSLKARKDCQ